MSVMDMNSRMAMAEKLSVQQLQQAVQSGSLPAYIGIPLIEQKTKEKSQMAAAQQGQQRPQSVAASILQQAEQQEQQERGIDELPSNLPMMEDEEVGMAGGGIIAFAERGRVNDPYAEDFAPSGTDYSYVEGTYEPLDMSKDERKRIAEETSMGINLENDPSSYLSEYAQNLVTNVNRAENPSQIRTAFINARKAEADARAEAIAKEGRENRAERERVGLPMADRLNVPGINPFTPQERVNQGVRDEVPNPPGAFKNEPKYDPVSASPAGRYIENLATDLKGTLGTYDLREKLYKQYSPAALGLSSATNDERAAAQEMLTRIRDMSGPELRALEEQGRPPAMTAVETTSAPSRPQPTAAPEAPTPQARQADADLDNQMLVDSNTGIAGAPGAKLAPPGTPGAPRPAPTGSTSAPRTAPQGSGQGGGERGSAMPPTLGAAEKSNSPVAEKAVSMLDKYVAQLEKSGESVGRDKKEAMYMALIQGGLAAAGGTSPNALANLAAGFVPAVQSYQQALRDIKKEDRARLEKLIGAGLKKEEFMLKAEEIGVKRETARMVYDAAMARTGAMGGSSAGADKQARLFAFNAGRDLNRVIADAAKLKNSEEYKEATRILNMPYDPKKPNPAIKQMRERAQSVVNSINQEATGRIEDARSAVEFYRSEAGMPPLTQSSPAGGGSNGLQMPKTKGELKIGEVYNTARGPAKWDGNQFVSVK